MVFQSVLFVNSHAGSALKMVEIDKIVSNSFISYCNWSGRCDEARQR